MSEVTLMQGDCLERMKQIPDGAIDMVLTDPPYGTIKGLWEGTDWDNCLDHKKMLSIINKVLRPNGTLALFSQEPYTSQLISNPHGSIPFSYRLNWIKDSFANHLSSKKAPVNYVEDICIFFKAFDSFTGHPLKPYMDEQLAASGLTRRDAVRMWGSSASHYFTDGRQFGIPSKEKLKKMQKETGRFQMSYEQMKEITNTFRQETKEKYPKVFNLPNGEKCKSNLLEYRKDYGGHHPTQKPVALLEDLIRTYTNEGDTVLDFTMGSGSTGVACVNTNRDFIGIELDSEYFNIAQSRIQETKERLV